MTEEQENCFSDICTDLCAAASLLRKSDIINEEELERIYDSIVRFQKRVNSTVSDDAIDGISVQQKQDMNTSSDPSDHSAGTIAVLVINRIDGLYEILTELHEQGELTDEQNQEFLTEFGSILSQFALALNEDTDVFRGAPDT
jgi:hypothetical protein